MLKKDYLLEIDTMLRSPLFLNHLMERIKQRGNNEMKLDLTIEQIYDIAVEVQNTTTKYILDILFPN